MSVGLTGEEGVKRWQVKKEHGDGNPHAESVDTRSRGPDRSHFSPIRRLLAAQGASARPPLLAELEGLIRIVTTQEQVSIAFTKELGGQGQVLVPN